MSLCYQNQRIPPNPPRIWSRVVGPCATGVNYDPNQLVYFAPTKKYIPQKDLYYATLMYKKGNILQYKNNSSNLSKKQIYAQIAKGKWCNRTTTWATQSSTFTDPNTRSLMRVDKLRNIYLINRDYTEEKETCPFLYSFTPIENIIIPDGGTLLCNATENVCTGAVKIDPIRGFCNPTSNSDVPGPIQLLCWNDGTQTWYPRNNVVMNSSGGNKFPQGYKYPR